MPPKRDAGTTSAQPPMKMIKLSSDAPEFGCDPVEDKYRLPEESSYSPFPNNENDTIEFDEENISSPGIRTDTISLLMKIEQLQAQLKYERRCRILAERELREMKEMNNLMMQMRHTAHELRVTLDHVLHGGEAGVGPQNSQDESTCSFLAQSDAEMRAVHNIPEDDQNLLFLAENLRVPRNLYERIAEIADYKKYTSALLMILFDRETLATHSLQGRRNTFTGEDCHKPQLPPEILRSIIDHVADKFGVDCSQIKTAIRTKLNNEDKLLKKRMGLVKTENKAIIDQSFCHGASLLPENEAMGNDSQL
ncbi:hypothetical protein JOB18_041545 [Solea senegalensis]|uniref:BEN domain-containing protein n=1 Tax=Solea senegalensis TaxID=28829 RepID=A0AAV6QPD4_SOLSE|nr:uncharacterized protein LOC122767888 [Solea senegalensis]XP_043879373.1 uncharacterized protein LOC122767888 [Solea senegalensis]KAG7494988.1 hypothetical protein JOB18_041545 [Solea senegalensis]KAG7494989.1 hypothetical protein JOB18_041545 [Solea senegalensis]